MRALFLAAFLILSAPLHAFEVEDTRAFGKGDLHIAILSTTDTAIFAPVIDAYLATRPELAVDYTVASSQEVFRAIRDEGARFDLVISSAMDLQMKLANDGFAGAVPSATALVPDWARWRDQLFGFALEPVVLLASRRALAGLTPPRTRRDLIDLLRENPARFDGRVATYDPHSSGAGYLFATQDARQTDAFWRLAEVMGRLNTRLYCCSSQMIDDLAAGRIAIAYNVVGPYAITRAATNPDLLLIEPEDFTVALLRTAFVPANAPQRLGGAQFLEFMLAPQGQRLLSGGETPPPLDLSALAPHIRPIRLDPGLLVYLDRIKRQGFLAEWDAAMRQP